MKHHQGPGRKLQRFLVAAGVMLGLCTLPVQAQAPSTSTPSEDALVYRFAGPGEATETIYVLGAVEKSGIWKVEAGTGLVQLFSLVRPSRYGVQTSRVNQEVRVRIHRTSGGQSRTVHDVAMSEVIAMRPSRRPSLKDGDIVDITVIEDRAFTFGTLSTIVGTLSSLALLGLRLFDR